MNGIDAGNDGLNIMQRFPYIEHPEFTCLSEISKMTGPRFLKSHLPYNCLPDGIEAGYGKVKAIKIFRQI